MFRNLKLLIFVAAIVLVAIVGGVTTGIILNSPKMVFYRSTTNFFEDLLEREEIAPVNDALNKGSVQFSLSDIEMDGSKLYDDLNAEGKLYFSKKGIMLSGLEVNGIGEIDIAANAYLSKDKFYIDEENILDGTYGVNLKDFADDLADSIFAYDSGSEYALDKATYEQILSIAEGLEDSTKFEKDAKKLFDDVLKDIMKIVFKHADVESETDKVRFDGKSKKVRVITVEIDEKAMENIIADVYDYLCDSDKIVEFLDKYEPTIVALSRNTGVVKTLINTYGSLAEAYEDILEDREEWVEDLIDNIDNVFSDVTIELVTPKSSAKLLKLEVEVGKTTLLSIDCGAKGIKKTDKVELELAGMELEYEVKKDDRKDFEAKLSLKKYGEEITLSIDIDRKTDKYTVKYVSSSEGYSYYSETNEYTIKGKISTKLGKTTLTVDKIVSKSEEHDTYGDYSWETTWELDCKIVIDGKDKMPSPKKKFNTIDDITEEDMEEWMEKLPFGARAENSGLDNDGEDVKKNSGIR